MTDKVHMKYLVVSLPLFLTVSSFAGIDLKGEIECYKALQQISVGEDYLVPGDTLMIPTKKDGKQGFYSYTPENAYFYELPVKAASVDQGYQTYYFSVQGPKKSKTYVKYNQYAKNPQINSLDNSPTPDKSMKLQDIKVFSYFTEKSMSALYADLKHRISSVANLYEENYKHFISQSKLNPASPRQDYPTLEFTKNKLKSCTKVAEIKDMVMKELSMLPSPMKDVDEDRQTRRSNRQ